MKRDTPTGTRIYAIDDAQNVVRGTLMCWCGPLVVMKTIDEGKLRCFHARYCQVDVWARLEGLP